MKHAEPVDMNVDRETAIITTRRFISACEQLDANLDLKVGPKSMAKVRRNLNNEGTRARKEGSGSAALEKRQVETVVRTLRDTARRHLIQVYLSCSLVQRLVVYVSGRCSSRLGAGGAGISGHAWPSSQSWWRRDDNGALTKQCMGHGVHVACTCTHRQANYNCCSLSWSGCVAKRHSRLPTSRSCDRCMIRWSAHGCSKECGAYINGNLVGLRGGQTTNKSAAAAKI